MSVILLVGAIVILLCLALSKVSSKLGVPTLLVFIFLGMLFGSDGIFRIKFDNYYFAEQICTIALIFIMFYGGFGTNWKQAKQVAVKSIMLSTVGVFMTALITGLFCHLVLRIDFWESMLIGSVIGSTDAASVFSILRSKKLSLKYNTASLLEVESGSNDPCAYMLTVIVLSFMKGGLSGGKIIYMVFSQMVYGAIIGVAVAFLARLILSNFKNGMNGFESMLVFSMAIISYSISSIVGGNGYLSVYITGIILGNTPINNKKILVNFFDGVTGLMQIFIFFLLGLLSFPSKLLNLDIVLISLAIAVFLTFVARPVAVSFILMPFKSPIRQTALVSWSGLRGAASIVFAIMAVVGDITLKHDVFHIVFFIVLFSILLQGTLIPFVAKKLNMIDENSSVMKTFTDYTEEVPIQFIKLLIDDKHPWNNKKIGELELLPNLIIALIIRNGEQVIPKGNTVILSGDIIAMSGASLDSDFNSYLTEIRIEVDNEWLGKSLSEIKFGADKLVVLIKREGEVIIPSGDTIINQDDVLIINQS